MRMEDVKVGDEYVLGQIIPGWGFGPFVWNTTRNPSRTIVTEITEKYVTVQRYGGVSKITPDWIWPIDEAKRMYRETLEKNSSHGQDHIDNCVREL